MVGSARRRRRSHGSHLVPERRPGRPRSRRPRRRRVARSPPASRWPARERRHCCTDAMWVSGDAHHAGTPPFCLSWLRSSPGIRRRRPPGSRRQVAAELARRACPAAASNVAIAPAPTMICRHSRGEGQAARGVGWPPRVGRGPNWSSLLLMGRAPGGGRHRAGGRAVGAPLPQDSGGRGAGVAARAGAGALPVQGQAVMSRPMPRASSHTDQPI
jgi:hypothetical protein